MTSTTPPSAGSASAAPGSAGTAGHVPSPREAYEAEVAAYVAAGGEPTVQRVITGVHSLARKLNQWYDRQLADLDLTPGEWAVLSRLATAPASHRLTPSELATLTSVAPSSMTHRLDRMTVRGLVTREMDPANRTRILVSLTDEGWQTFRAATQESDLVESDVLRTLSADQREDLAALLEIVIAGLDDR